MIGPDEREMLQSALYRWAEHADHPDEPVIRFAQHEPVSVNELIHEVQESTPLGLDFLAVVELAVRRTSLDDVVARFEGTGYGEPNRVGR